MTDTEAEATSSRAGRPRPQDTLSRDEQVLDLLRAHGPLTRKELAEKSGLKESIAYLSLHRLRGADRVEKFNDDGRAHVWRVKQADARA